MDVTEAMEWYVPMTSSCVCIGSNRQKQERHYSHQVGEKHPGSNKGDQTHISHTLLITTDKRSTARGVNQGRLLWAFLLINSPAL